MENEEMIVVLAGRPSLRTLDGICELRPGDIVACLIGRRGAHQLLNNSDEPVRVLVTSTMVYPEIAEQLDSDKVLVHTAPPGTADRLALAFPREAEVDRLARAAGAGRYRLKGQQPLAVRSNAPPAQHTAVLTVRPQLESAI